MAPIPPRTFAALLAGLSPAEFAAFVADLWRRRGRNARVEGDVVILGDGSGTTRRLLVSHEGGRFRRALRRLGAIQPPDASRADAVVTSVRHPGSGTGDDRVVDADDLRQAALYAIDRDDREALFDAYFGRSPVADAPSGRGLPFPATIAVLLALVGIVLVGLVAGTPGVFGGTAPAPDSDPAPDFGDDPVTPIPVPSATATPGADNAGVSYPPGLGPDGVTDAEALARTHSALLANSSYRWTITYREVVDGRTRGWARERVAVENATVYRSTVDHNGTLVDPTPVPEVSSYADGTVRYDRRPTNDGVRYRRHDIGETADAPPFGAHPHRLIALYLSLPASDTVTPDPEDPDIFRVSGEGDYLPRTRNGSTAAVVGDGGFVRTLRRTHSPPDSGARRARRTHGLPGSDVRIEIIYRLERVGNVTVSPPSWATEARRATA